MSLLTVRHVTVYRYSEPVELGEHRMMLRPRGSHDLRLLSTSLEITPSPIGLRWLHDVFDNSVAVATFDGAATELRFDSRVTLEHFEDSRPEYPLEEYAKTYPFRYSDEELHNLAHALVNQHPSDSLSRWRISKTGGPNTPLRSTRRRIRSATRMKNCTTWHTPWSTNIQATV